MKINKQSNIYTIVYIIVVVTVVGAALALTAEVLRPKQQANATADKMRQILYAVHLSPSPKEVANVFDSTIVTQLLVDTEGNILKAIETKSGNTSVFDIDVASQVKLPDDRRSLPVYVYRADDSASDIYIVPVYGAGLWGPIWGYVSVESDGSTVYGAYFSHSSETPGLGAEIEKKAFSDKFIGKRLFKDDRFLPIAVVKAGQVPANGEDYVDGISGGTITSKGVGSMLDNCLSPYAGFFAKIKN